MRVTFSGQPPLTPPQGEDSGARAPSLEGRVGEGLRGSLLFPSIFLCHITNYHYLCTILISEEINAMRKVYTLLMLFSLLAAGKAIAATGDVIIGYVTHIDKDGNSHSVKMQFQISDQTKRHLRIYGYEKEKSIYNSLSPSDTYYEGEIVEGEIIVPEKLSDYTVTSVGAKAFYMSKVKVTLPESVTEIEEYAFERY